MKWAFLLTRETSSRGGAAFYDFLPYKHGPYSFLLGQDIRNLVKTGLIGEPDEKTWSLLSSDDAALKPPRDLQDVARIMLRYGDNTLEDLIHSVYSRYPWFTINCERIRARLHERPVALPAVYTIGYQGLSIDAFLNRLLESGIETLADVRNTPLSRTFGFHRSTLLRLCENLGIEYQGFPELGVPSPERTDLKTQKDREALFDRYRDRVSRSQTKSLVSLAGRIVEKPTALLCMESDPTLCHRAQLADLISKRTSLSVIHL
jgi:uncharacterized protein (DUF488 family)